MRTMTAKSRSEMVHENEINGFNDVNELREENGIKGKKLIEMFNQKRD